MNMNECESKHKNLSKENVWRSKMKFFFLFSFSRLEQNPTFKYLHKRSYFLYLLFHYDLIWNCKRKATTHHKNMNGTKKSYFLPNIPKFRGTTLCVSINTQTNPFGAVFLPFLVWSLIQQQKIYSADHRRHVDFLCAITHTNCS